MSEGTKETKAIIETADQKSAEKDALIAELEDGLERTIEQRDAAEDALSNAFVAAVGESPEWSNLFGFGDAVEAIGARIAELEAEVERLKATAESLFERHQAALHRVVEAENARAAALSRARYAEDEVERLRQKINEETAP